MQANRLPTSFAVEYGSSGLQQSQQGNACVQIGLDVESPSFIRAVEGIPETYPTYHCAKWGVKNVQSLTFDIKTNISVTNKI